MSGIFETLQLSSANISECFGNKSWSQMIKDIQMCDSARK